MKIRFLCLPVAALISFSALAQTPQAATEQDDAESAMEQAAYELLSMDEEQLDDMAVTNAEGEDLGEVEEIVRERQTGQHYVVVEMGGTLGLGENEALIPLNKLHYNEAEDRLIAETSLEDLKAQQHFDDVEDQYEEIEEAE